MSIDLAFSKRKVGKSAKRYYVWPEADMKWLLSAVRVCRFFHAAEDLTVGSCDLRTGLRNLE